MSNHPGLLLKMHPWAVKVSKGLTLIYVAAAIFLLTQGLIFQALFSLVLAAVFLSTILLNSMALQVDEKIRKINSILSLVKDLNLTKTIENKNKLVLFLFSLDLLNYQKKGKSFTTALWIKKNQRPYSLLVDMVVDSFLGSQGPKETLELNQDDQQMIQSHKAILSQSLIEINAHIRQNIISFDQLKENTTIRFTS